MKINSTELEKNILNTIHFFSSIYTAYFCLLHTHGHEASQVHKQSLHNEEGRVCLTGNK